MSRLILLIPATIVMAGMLHAQGTRVVFDAGNPLVSNSIRNGYLRASTVLYHHAVARAKYPALLASAHFHTMPDVRPFLATDILPQYLIANLAQEQAATFLTSGGRSIYNANYWTRMWFGADLFELNPARLPDEMN